MALVLSIMVEKQYRIRRWMLYVLVGVVFFGIGVRLVILNQAPDAWILEKLERGRRVEQKIAASRGRIVDRNGEILGLDKVFYHVCADPHYIKKYGDRERVVQCLSHELRMPQDTIDHQLRMTDRQYVRLKKYVPGYQLRRFTQPYYGRVVYTPAEHVYGVNTNITLRGVMLEEAPRRNYPKGALMAHVVGFSNLDGIGSAGVEQEFDHLLRGKDGVRVSVRDGQRNEIYSHRVLDEPPVPGADVTLTLDQQIQYVVEGELEKIINDFDAKAAWAIVQEVRTGEILAMASYPSYDLNRYSKTPAEWRRNRTISFNYEPGSVMKPAIIAAAIEHGLVAEEDIIDCENGRWVYGGKSLWDSHPMGLLTVEEILQHSSNIGAAKIALMMESATLYASLRDFGFGSRTGIDLAGEECGIFHKPENWSKISATRLAMGHEIGATAMQVLSMISTIANNGRRMRPQIIKEITAVDGRMLQHFSPEEVGRPISADTAQRVRKMMVRVTEDEGTGVKAAVEGYSVAGKTGTAQKVRPRSEGGGYYRKRFISSFVGFLPAENPRISIIVVADDPGTYDERGRKINYYGGTVCGPAFKSIASFSVRYLRIPPEGVKLEHIIDSTL